MPRATNDFLYQFGDIAFFDGILKEGFSEVACGSARDYYQGSRVAALFAFYRPEGAPQTMDFVQVPTWQVIKERTSRNGERESDYALPCEVRYSESALRQYCVARRISLGQRMSLADVVCAMQANETEN